MTQPTTVSDVRDDRIRSVSLTDNGRREDIFKAFLILKYTHDSAAALLRALQAVRRERGVPRGALTDEEQDLLRAMLVMAGSGLDSMTKQLCRESLPTLCRTDEKALAGFRKYVSRQLRGSGDTSFGGKSTDFLADVLTSDSVQNALIDAYINELAGGSLQSASELSKIATALDVPLNLVSVRELKPIFDDRHKIIHELDIDFDEPRRNRRSRRMGQMIRATNWLLLVGERLYSACEDKLNGVKGS